MAAVCMGLLPEHRAPVARHLHDQFALAPFWFAPLRNQRHQQEQLAARVAHARRRLAQQPSSLYGLGAPGLLLVGDRHHLLHPESPLLVRNRLGPAQSSHSSVDPRPARGLKQDLRKYPGHPAWAYFTLLLSGISPLLNAVFARLDFHLLSDSND